MAFCPECGKPTTPEASKCVSCGHELEAKPAPGVKTGAARFKGTMLMATAPTVAKVPENKGDPAKPAAVAAPVVASPAAGVGAAKPQAKATMIGTGLGAAPGAVANDARPARPARPADEAAAPIARAVAPNVGGASPKSTVIGAGIAPAAMAAAAAAHAARPAAAPIAAAAAGAVAQASAARPAAAKPDDSKRNMAYAQTQHQGAFAGSQSLATGTAPRTSPNLGAATAAAEAFDPHAETDPPEPIASNDNRANEVTDEDDPVDSREASKYLPGDPMAPQTQPAARAPMLRYDDSMPNMSRSGGDEKKWLWIAAGVIVIACLGLVIMLASRMSH